MSNEYIIVNKSAIQKIDKLVKEANAGKTISSINSQMAESLIRFKEQLLSQSTPLLPEIEKAMNAAREIQDDSAHDTFTAEDISGCTEVCTHGWRYKTTNKDYISNLKLDI